MKALNLELIKDVTYTIESGIYTAQVNGLTVQYRLEVSHTMFIAELHVSFDGRTFHQEGDKDTVANIWNGLGRLESDKRSTEADISRALVHANLI